MPASVCKSSNNGEGYSFNMRRCAFSLVFNDWVNDDRMLCMSAFLSVCVRQPILFAHWASIQLTKLCSSQIFVEMELLSTFVCIPNCIGAYSAFWFCISTVGVKSFFNIQLRSLLASHFWSIPSTRKEKLLVNNERRKNAHFISNASEDRKTQHNKNMENRIIWVGAIPILQFCLSDQLVSQTKR